MHKRYILVLAAIVASIAQPATAQSRFDFFKAVRDGDFAIVSKGVEGAGKMVNARDDEKGATALLLVTEQRRLDWMNYMLRNGANPDLAARNGDRPLHIAAQTDFVEGVKLLLDGGATVDARGIAGETPLARAVRMRNVETVKLLLRRGADPDLSDISTGRSARDYAQEDPRGRAMLDAIEQIEREKAGESAPQLADFDFSGDFLSGD